MSRINLVEMENISHGKFTYHGEQWRMVDEQSGGTSAKGLWFIVTNGADHERIFKKDLLDKGLVAEAIALFN